MRSVLSNVRVFRYEELSVLEDWLSDKYHRFVKFEWHQPPVSPIPEIKDDELVDLRRKVTKLYRRDCLLFGYEWS